MNRSLSKTLRGSPVVVAPGTVRIVHAVPLSSETTTVASPPLSSGMVPVPHALSGT